ncbi:hypothetical protein ABT346_15005 [Micromonospora peucetia]|uniref:hypothetical protein n=1 Tax=Micromonospora peucetia TaxID=47871 RepID=UPI00332357C4
MTMVLLLVFSRCEAEVAGRLAGLADQWRDPWQPAGRTGRAGSGADAVGQGFRLVGGGAVHAALAGRKMLVKDLVDDLARLLGLVDAG